VSNISPSVTKTRIFNVFKNIRIGHIKKVNILLNKKVEGGPNQAFIHYDVLYNTEHTKRIVNRLYSSSNADIKVMYNEPKFWKVKLCNASIKSYSQTQAQAQTQ